MSGMFGTMSTSVLRLRGLFHTVQKCLLPKRKCINFSVEVFFMEYRKGENLSAN